MKIKYIIRLNTEESQRRDFIKEVPTMTQRLNDFFIMNEEILNTKILYTVEVPEGCEKQAEEYVKKLHEEYLKNKKEYS